MSFNTDMAASQAEKARQKRELIMKAAAKVFYEKGFPKGTIVDIAHEAGLPMGSPTNISRAKKTFSLTSFALIGNRLPIRL